MKSERTPIHQVVTHEGLLKKAQKLLKRVRDKLVPEQTPPEFDPRASARQKAEDFARYLSERRSMQKADRTFTNSEEVYFGNIVRPLPAALRFEINLKPEITKYEIRKYRFLILVMEDNKHYLFHALDFDESVDNDGFIFRMDENKDLMLIDMTEAFGDALEVYDFGRYYWARLTGEDADDIDDSTRVDLITAGMSQKEEAKARQTELIGFPAWQT